MIELVEIRKRYGTVPVLDGVSLEVRPGSVLALVGPNGAGKTTLIKILLGLTYADSGDVLVNGARADRSGEYRRELGYMPQMARFPGHLMVGDFFTLLSDLRRAEPRDDELIAELGLRAEWKKPLGELSGGTRQKVNAAAALMFRPAVLVLDEPTAGLDPVASGAFKAKLLRARDAGCAVLVTGHVMAELEELADRVAFLSDGRLSYQGDVSALLRSTRTRRLEGAVAHLLRKGAA